MMKHCKAISLLLLVLILTLTGCSNQIVANDLLVIERNNDHCVLNFNDGNYKDDLYIGGCVVYSNDAQFSSLQDVYDSITTGTFDEYQLLTIRNFFPRDAKDRIIIVDPDRLCEPVIPSGLTHSVVRVEGSAYSVHIKPKNADYTEPSSLYPIYQGDFTPMSADEFKTAFDAYNCFNDDFEYNFTVSNVEDRNATVYEYSTESTKVCHLQYSIQTANKVLFIEEFYLLEAYHGSISYSDYTDTLPHHISILGCENGMYFRFDLDFPRVRPSVEWLSSFGATKFIPKR